MFIHSFCRWPCFVLLSALLCMGSAQAQNTAASAPLTLVYHTVTLPWGAVGAAYDRVVASGGTPPYKLQLLGKALPAGLAVTSDGKLTGKPSESGKFEFTLRAVDSAGVETHQAYVLNIGTPSASKTAKPAVISGEALINPPERNDMAYMVVWKLLPEHVKEIAKEEEAAAAELVPATPEAAAAAAAMAAATSKKPDRLARLVEPMLGIEYPTQAMFEAALAMHHRDLCRQIVSKLVAQHGQEVALAVCQPGKATAGATGTAGTANTAPEPLLQADDTLKPDEVYATLLSPRLKNKLLAKARKVHDFSVAQRAVFDSAGCGCGPTHQENQVYALLPFWQATGEKQAVDFSAFTRLGVLGAYLRDTGDVVASKYTHDSAQDGLRTAQKHNTQLDLVLYRNEWARLLAQDEATLEQTTRRAVRQAMDQVDTPFTDFWTRLRRTLQPALPEAKYLYSGITVFFDYTPTVKDSKTGATDMPAYRKFFRGFMLQLIAEMRARGRDYALNIVVPEQLIAEPGSAYSVEDLLDYMQRTQPLLAGSIAQTAKAEAKAHGSKVVTRVVVMLPEPTTDSKKRLRLWLDQTHSLRGDVRTALLDSLMPLFVFPHSDKNTPMTGLIAEQFDDDLTYAEWQFGGAAVWPLPMKAMGAGDSVVRFIFENFRDKKDAWLAQGPIAKRVCTVVCPIRTWVKLGFEALLVLGAVSIGLYFFNCKVRERGGRLYLLGLVLGGVLTAIVGLSLLYCDPALVALSEGNTPLVVTLALVLMYLLYSALNKKQPKP